MTTPAHRDQISAKSLGFVEDSFDRSLVHDDGLALDAAGDLAAVEPRAAAVGEQRVLVAEDALELRHGVVRRVHSAIPYFRVQHIDVAQGPVERAVGLARLIVHTASAGTDATIPGIAAGDAEGLRRLILARAGHGDAV